MKTEILARFLLAALIGAGLAIPLGGRYLFHTGQKSTSIELHGRTPENGGWSDQVLEGNAGETLHLRMTSDDVVHGFAVGKSGQPAIDVVPGKYTELDLRFDQPGTYTFYCTRWCGPNHWRMRGTIEVRGGQTSAAPPGQPLFVRLALDLDAAPAPLPFPPETRPSAERGEALGIELPAEFSSQDYLRTHSPADLFDALKAQPLGQRLTDLQVWDLVAYAWRFGASAEILAEGEDLYSQNCAACHGEQGRGDGVMVEALTDGTPAATSGMEGDSEMGEGTPMGDDAGFGHTFAAPPDFTDTSRMLALNSARLQGKIVRGGMGTGMPYWGPILTEEQTWALVSYLWTFAMD